MSTACSQVGSSTGGVSPGSPTGAASCTPPGGGRCAGPEPVGRWLVDQLGVDATGTVISGRFQCGGALEASETSSRVLLTYIASAVGFGGMACMLVPLSVQLTSPLGDRAVIDGVTGEHLDVATSTASGRE